YNTDGSLDTTFNPTGSLPGTVTTNFGGTDVANDVVLQKDGKIVAVGRAVNDFGVARYSTNGNLDTTFNPTGILPGTVTTDFGGTDFSDGVVIQKDGKIVAAGSSGIDFVLARYVVFKRGVDVQNCTAEENGEDGFNIAGSAYLVRDSSAIHNALNGFSLASLTDGCQLLSNQALQNNNSGFFLESLTDNCQLISNSALQNTNVGIKNLGSLNQIFNSRAHANVGGDYVGISLDVNPPTDTTGFWANIRGV
ncbi:MAG: delta-60 repeat domain-containing protein, partial [Candidatus Babeliales bacterium]